MCLAKIWGTSCIPCTCMKLTLTQLQVSFFRANLTFGVLDKRRCVSKDGKTHEGHALVDYIRYTRLLVSRWLQEHPGVATGPARSFHAWQQLLSMGGG